MDELISAARIGRSLGVHLILATQKPSGVVNDQIWSNARFKVCLKVADEADSREMIKRTDAAALSQAGRFYLLVGYNEYFALGQAAYAGTPYQPQERYAPVTDESVTLISDTGRQLVSVKPEHARGGDADGSEAVAVLQVVQQVAAEEGLAARRLWMEPVPSMVTVDGLARKYRCPPGGDSMPDSFALAPIIGELDDPAHQRQGVLTLDLAEGGNVLVYGTADSGAELVLGSLLYGVLQSFPPAALHVYALDFGSESLRAFAEAPQVGDVIGIADEEKVNRFFGFIDKERVRRRDAMAPYGGSFVRYRAAGGSMAATVVIVNDVAAFNEAYPKLEERMEKFVRESGRYGIYLVMAADGTSSVRMRMRQTFRQLLACDLADTSDYAMIFGSVRGIPLPHGYGRGLVKTEGGIFEFQAAHLSESGDDYAIAQKMSRDMAESAATQGLVAAPPVPMVPDIVRVEDLTHEASALGAVPFGIFEDTLEIARFDFEDAAIVRAVFQRRRSGERFARSLVETAVLVGFSAVHVVDAAGLLGSEKPHGCAYATRKPEAGSAKLLEMLGRASRARDEAGAREGSPIPDVRPMLFIISGISRVLAATSYDEANELKGLLRGLTPQGGVNLVLLDAVADVDYGYDDWSKAQLSSKSGLWIGPGIDAQSTISVSYTPGLAPDAVMKKDRGYLIEGGLPRLVRLVSAPRDA